MIVVRASISFLLYDGTRRTVGIRFRAVPSERNGPISTDRDRKNRPFASEMKSCHMFSCTAPLTYASRSTDVILRPRAVAFGTRPYLSRANYCRIVLHNNGAGSRDGRRRPVRINSDSNSRLKAEAIGYNVL